MTWESDPLEFGSLNQQSARISENFVDKKKKSSVYHHQLVVEQDDIDELNHVNNLRYLKWCLKAAVAHSSHVGWTSKRYHESGFGFIVREHKIKYRVPAILNDEIEIKTWIESMERVSSNRRYNIFRKSDGKKLAEAATTWVFVDLDTLELTKIPSEIRQAFQLNSGLAT